MPDNNNNGIEDSQEVSSVDISSGLSEIIARLSNSPIVSKSDPKVTVPGWVTNSSGTSTAGLSTFVNLPYQWAQQGAAGKKKLDKLATMLFGTGATLNDIAIGWENTLKLSAMSQSSADLVAKNGMMKSSIYTGTSFEIKDYKPYKQVTLTSKDDAKTILSSLMLKYLDKGPTKDEFNAFYKSLLSMQKKNPVTTTPSAGGSVTTGGGINAEQFALNYVLSKIKTTDPNLNGQLGEYQNAIVSLAKNNGITLSDADVVKMVKDIANGADFNSYKVQLNEKAQKKYAALAEQLKANPDATVMDLSSDYIRTMADMLEINPTQISLKDIEPAISAIGQDGKQRTLANWEWQKQLRQDQRFQFTNRAKGEAASTAVSFARAFGANI